MSLPEAQQRELVPQNTVLGNEWKLPWRTRAEDMGKGPPLTTAVLRVPRGGKDWLPAESDSEKRKQPAQGPSTLLVTGLCQPRTTNPPLAALKG